MAMTMMLKFDHWVSEVLRNVISDLVTSGEEARIILLVLLRNHSPGKSSNCVISGHKPLSNYASCKNLECYFSAPRTGPCLINDKPRTINNKQIGTFIYLLMSLHG